MKKLMGLAAFAGILSLTTPAAQAAQTQWFNPENFYVGAGYTYSLFKGDIDDTDMDYNLSQLGVRGGYRFHRYFGVEIEASFGVGDDDFHRPYDANNATDEYSVKAKNKYQVGGYLVGFYPVYEQIDLLARIGYIKSSYDLEYRNDYPSVPEAQHLRQKSTLDLNTYSLGVGAHYHITDHQGVRFDYTYFKKDKQGVDFTNHAFSLSYTYNF